jgi:hypothetical protein
MRMAYLPRLSRRSWKSGRQVRPSRRSSTRSRCGADHNVCADDPAADGLQYGCNPTGATATLERRTEVLQLAEAHDLLILEGTPPPLRRARGR